MRRIYKYEVYPNGIPVRYRGHFRHILEAKMLSDGRMYVWIETDDKCSEEWEIELISFGTGWDIDEIVCGEIMEYAGTIEDMNGYVWHIYAREVC